MRLPLRLSLRAEREVMLAIWWYRLQRTGRVRRFLADLDRTFRVIEQFPRGAQVIKKNIRQMPLDRFPFVVVYAIRRKEITVLSVFNTRQHPMRKP